MHGRPETRLGNKLANGLRLEVSNIDISIDIGIGIGIDNDNDEVLESSCVYVCCLRELYVRLLPHPKPPLRIIGN